MGVIHRILPPMTGEVSTAVIRGKAIEEVAPLVQSDPKSWLPQTDLKRLLHKARSYLPTDLFAELMETIGRYTLMESALSIAVIRADGRIDDYGIVSRKVVTNAGADYLAKAFGGQSGFEPENFNFHGIGTSSTAEAVTDTALVAEITVYQSANTRATGVRSNPAVRQYRSVGANVVTAAVTITEHGQFDQASTSGGNLWDRSIFTGIALLSGDQLQTTYDLTVQPGG